MKVFVELVWTGGILSSRLRPMASRFLRRFLRLGSTGQQFLEGSEMCPE